MTTTKVKACPSPQMYMLKAQPCQTWRYIPIISEFRMKMLCSSLLGKNFYLGGKPFKTQNGKRGMKQQDVLRGIKTLHPVGKLVKTGCKKFISFRKSQELTTLMGSSLPKTI